MRDDQVCIKGSGFNKLIQCSSPSDAKYYHQRISELIAPTGSNYSVTITLGAYNAPKVSNFSDGSTFRSK